MNKAPALDRRQFLATACAATLAAHPLLADEPNGPPTEVNDNQSMPNLVTKTAGGKQLWADVWFFHAWHIQRHALTGHHRLLDATGNRHAWGTFATCRKELDAIRTRDSLPPMQGKAVVALHGLFRSRSAMDKVCGKLTKDCDYATFNVGYPTTRGSVADHAASLDSVFSSLEGITEINFIAHSLGNLVVRHWLKDLADGNRTLPPGQVFGHMVMLAPPNHHPQIAAKFLSNQLANLLAGPAAEQLATGWKELEPRLATPAFQFGILAGGKGDDKGYNPLILGDDDGVVTVDSTRLAGARDFRCLPVLHTFFPDNPQVHEMAMRFLAEGYFESEATRRPVVYGPAKEPA